MATTTSTGTTRRYPTREDLLADATEASAGSPTSVPVTSGTGSTACSTASSARAT